MTDASFNLLTEPWIPVRPLGSPSLRLVSLREALAAGRDFSGVEDSSPLQTVAVYRLMLAVLHRALMGPKDADEALEYLEAGQFPPDALESYLERYAPRFDLFGPQPFLQVPDLPTDGYVQTWERLGAEVGGGNTTLLFNPTRREGYVSPALTPAEAARRLIEHQTFALGGLTRKFTSAATGAPVATAALIMARGRNLHETLCLNLVPYVQGIEADVPPWEAAPLTLHDMRQFYPNGGKEKLAQPVRGIVQGYVWQGRSVRLEREQDGSVRFIAYAEGVPPNLAASWRDPMVALRPLKDGTLYPLKLSAERLFWRDFEAILPDRSRELAATEDGRVRFSQGAQPAVLQHAFEVLGELRGSAVFSLPLMVFGQVNDQAKIELWRFETYDLPPAVLGDPEVAQHVPDALTRAKDVRDALNAALRRLAEGLLSSGERDPHKDDISRLTRSLGAEQQYWSQLERPFQAFVLALREDAAPALSGWNAQLRAAALDAWELAGRGAGQSARALRARYEAEPSLMKQLYTLTGGQRDRAAQTPA
ncbi:CRISPR system Cascade subunit CasA [Deinobacterium chartae]|uniref:CRISPR system Cascade subunit CasA n=1 Tax=Deinobacterium chartae TaxID=521158 RepID=A0A841I860_9DEIO|nr:type I-E CRISPR-associated protein Cse1/CasA [Deinobacterium chartae]MBB6100012.1 CRISPR system Cascade subunit CasA [Deinobacterium chartae]